MQEEKFRAIELGLPPEEKSPYPRIDNVWQSKRGATYRITLEHRDFACDPQTNCEGLITTSFRSKKRSGEKQSICLGCEKEVQVSIPVLKIELNLIP